MQLSTISWLTCPLKFFFSLVFFHGLYEYSWHNNSIDFYLFTSIFMRPGWNSVDFMPEGKKSVSDTRKSVSNKYQVPSRQLSRLVRYQIQPAICTYIYIYFKSILPSSYIHICLFTEFSTRKTISDAVFCKVVLFSIELCLYVVPNRNA